MNLDGKPPTAIRLGAALGQLLTCAAIVLITHWIGNWAGKPVSAEAALIVSAVWQAWRTPAAGAHYHRQAEPGAGEHR